MGIWFVRREKMNKFGRGGGRGMDRYDPKNPPKYLDPNNYKNENLSGCTNKAEFTIDEVEGERDDMSVDITSVESGEPGAVSSNEIEVKGPSAYVEPSTN